MTLAFAIASLAVLVFLLLFLAKQQEVGAVKSVLTALHERNDLLEEKVAQAATARDQALVRLEKVVAQLKAEIKGLEAALETCDDPRVVLARLRELANWNPPGR